MSIANCTRCGRMFQKTTGSRVCIDCKDAEELAYRQVRDYLEQQPGSDIQTVSQGTGVDEGVILKLLQDGRLVAMGDLASGMAIQCERCGGPTTSGRLCNPCVEAQGQAFKTSVDLLSGEAGPSRIRRPEPIQEKHGGHSSSRPDRR
jgi:uncharacterized protein